MSGQSEPFIGRKRFATHPLLGLFPFSSFNFKIPDSLFFFLKLLEILRNVVPRLDVRDACYKLEKPICVSFSLYLGVVVVLLCILTRLSSPLLRL